MSPRPRALLLLATLALLAAGSAFKPAEPFAPGRVQQLTLDSFDDEVGRGPFLVYVGAEWCGHCQKLKPVWAEVAKTLRGSTGCGYVDGNRERVLQTRLGVRGYPSIFLFRDGTMRSYTGARTAPAILAWAGGEYKHTAVAPFHKTPNNVLGRLLGRLLRLPSVATGLWGRARLATGLSDAPLIGVSLLVGLVGAVVAIFALDALVHLSMSQEARPHQA